MAFPFSLQNIREKEEIKMAVQYASNSINKKKEESKPAEKKKVVKVIKGKAKTKPQSGLKKAVGSIISDESKNIKSYILQDVVIPTIQDTLAHIIKGTVDMMFYGEIRSSKSRGSRGSNGSRISYSSIYDRDRRDDRRDERRARSTTHAFDDVLFDSLEDANEVLQAMDEIVEEYGVVRVADLFELAGVSGNGYTDQNYGWTSTKNAKACRDRHGDYYIDICRPCPIK